jgi:pimeloyl-ACP methyl ester carboxylesterase
LHGFTGTWRIWKPLLPALEANHDVLAVTLPGHRGGPPVSRGAEVGITLLADGVERTLDAAGVGAAHICGNSLGGWLALELARRGRARSVVTLSPAGGWREAKDVHRTSAIVRRSAQLGSLTAPLLRGPLLAPQARRAMLAMIMEHGDRIPAGAMLQLMEDAGGCTIIEQFGIAVFRDGPFTGDMSHVSCPVRIAWGQNDRIIPPDRHGRPLLDRVPNAEFVVMPGVGHVPMYDDPMLVTAAILEVTLAVDGRDGDRSRNGFARGDDDIAGGDPAPTRGAR